MQRRDRSRETTPNRKLVRLNNSVWRFVGSNGSFTWSLGDQIGYGATSQVFKCINEVTI